MQKIDDPETLAYLAEVIDGKGSIQLSKQRRVNRTYYTLMLSVSNTDRRLIDWLSTNFGGTVTETSAKQKRSAWFRWLVSDRRAQEILQALIPYSQIKQEQIVIALACHFNPIRGTYSDIEEQLRALLYEALKKLHHGGSNAES